MNKSINQIRKELRFIKSSQKAIRTYLESEESYQKRIDWLKSQKQSKSVQKDIISTQKVLDALKLNVNIHRLAELEEFYITNINKLTDEYDKLVLTKVYMQGHTYNKVCLDLCYSFDGIKKRIERALVKLKEIISKNT